MEPTTKEKNGQNQEDRQDTEPNSIKPHKPGKGRYMIVSALIGILVLAARSGCIHDKEQGDRQRNSRDGLPRSCCG